MVGRFPGTALEGTAVAAGLIAFGYLLADFVCGRRDVDRLFRWAMALPALVGWILVLMVAHMLSGGRVLSHVWVVRIATGLAAAGLIGAKLA
ncbi:MAG TPA: hypothetical protein VF972_01035, partial [Actinomycetota bacterium]